MKRIYFHVKRVAIRFWQWLSTGPSAEEIQAEELRQAKIEYLRAKTNVEDHTVNAHNYQEHVWMLEKRIERLSQGEAHNV